MALARKVKVLLVAATVVTAAGIVSVALRPPSPRQQFFDIRDDLQAARRAADDCAVALLAEEDSIRAFIDRTDSIRSRIGSLEGIDRRGVPVDSYAIYLESIDSFNAAVPGWREARDSLGAHRDACEVLIEQHNVIADSARLLAERASLIDSSLDTAAIR